MQEMFGEFKGGVVVTDYRTEKEREIEREARASVSLGPELDGFVDELVEIGLTEGFFGEGESSIGITATYGLVRSE